MSGSKLPLKFQALMKSILSERPIMTDIQSKVGQTFIPSTPLEDCNAAFVGIVEGKRKTKSGEAPQTYAQVFLNCVRCLSAARSFTYTDLLRGSKWAEDKIPREEMKRLFELWTDALEKLNKLERLDSSLSCYDEDVFLWVH
jgi:hypothetical protein